MAKLVIVESPAKAKTIGKYLGKDYKVTASMGHIRDLPASQLGIDVENGYTPRYITIKGKEKLVRELKDEAKHSDGVLLATDPDREGEAISWHLANVLGLDPSQPNRITFDEITKKGVQEGMAHPRAIDMDLFNAQQARRELDRLVGYKLSPFLWRKVRRGLSAGRVQSVAVRLIRDREIEIEKFIPDEYWNIDAEFGKGRTAFTARLAADAEGKKLSVTNKDQADGILAALEGKTYTVTQVDKGRRRRVPPPPFITSTLQQEASRKLNMTPRRTMSIAQQLYEGVDIEGEGTVGLITYMRTDSLRLSDEATAAAKDFILARYGADYYPGKARVYKTKSGAQDAHEAIRPSNVNLTPEDIKKSLTAEQYKLYKLIWSRFLACQMASAVYDSVSIEVTSAGYTFRATHSALKFSGYTAVYVEGKDEEEEAFQSPLPDLKEGEALKLEALKPDQHFTQPPSRYTEATLIKALEEKGIGRPSTYAPTISTILDREYVVKEGKNLRPTPLGEVVTGLMKDKFTDIVDTAFTATMEERLDEVETGKVDWKSLLGDFYGDFEQELQKAEADLDGERIKVPDEVSDVICPKCGRNLVYKSGRFGRFLACPGWPECDHTQPIVIEMPGKCPKCGGKILKKTSKRGYAYYGCENNSSKDEAKRCDFMTWDVPVKETCPECGHTLFKKSGRGFKKPFCINPECPNFLPEDQRGYKKKAASAESPAEGAPPEEEKKPAQKAAAKKTAAKKPAAKTAAAKKTAAPKKTAAKKPTAKKAAAKTKSEA